MRRNLRLIIEHKTQSNDNFDEGIDKWQQFSPVWVRFTSSTGSEGTEAQQIKGRIRYVAESEFISGVTSAMRVVGGGVTYEIESVVNRGMGNKILDWVLVSNG